MRRAQVTYGYTSATFSGRMPAVEVADAIVQTGRESLEKVRLGLAALGTTSVLLTGLMCAQAMETIKATRRWGAQVVYGDTDSLFIYLPGKTKDEAFRIGNEMADVITQQNPRPIKLKFEKVRLSRSDPSLSRSVAEFPSRARTGLPPLRPRRQEALRRLQVRVPAAEGPGL